MVAHIDKKLSDDELNQIKIIAEELNIEDYNPIDEVKSLPKNINIFLHRIHSEDAKSYLLSQIIHFCFYDGKYDASERLSLFNISRELGKSEEFILELERDYAVRLAATNVTDDLAAAAEKNSKSQDEFSWGKAALVGGLTVGGGLLLFVTGGIAAPAVGGIIGSHLLGYSGAAAVSAGLATLGGGALAAGGLGMAGGTFLVSSVFGVGGALAAAGSANNLLGELEEFKLERIDLERYACHSLICIHGFLQQGHSSQDEWSAVMRHDIYSDIYSLSWESKKLKHLTEALTNLAGNLAIAQGMGFVAKSGLKAAGGLFALPATVISAFKIIDNPWSVARNRSDKAGVVLGKVIAEMKSPISLLGYSLGSRVIVEALHYLNQNQIYGKIFDIYLMAGAVSQNHDFFKSSNFKKIVINNFYNVYSNKDFVLTYLYRTVEWGDKPIGLVPLKMNEVINIDVSELIEGHLDYSKKLDVILKKCSLN